MQRSSPHANIRWQASSHKVQAKLSPAEALRLVFVGASLLANRANERSPPHANIRWQACLPQNTSQTPAKALHLVFVGASLLANGAGKRASPQAKIRLQASSYRGKARSCLCICRSQPAGDSKKALGMPSEKMLRSGLGASCLDGRHGRQAQEQACVVHCLKRFEAGTQQLAFLRRLPQLGRALLERFEHLVLCLGDGEAVSNKLGLFGFFNGLFTCFKDCFLSGFLSFNSLHFGGGSRLGFCDCCVVGGCFGAGFADLLRRCFSNRFSNWFSSRFSGCFSSRFGRLDRRCFDCRFGLRFVGLRACGLF